MDSPPQVRRAASSCRVANEPCRAYFAFSPPCQFLFLPLKCKLALCPQLCVHDAAHLITAQASEASLHLSRPTTPCSTLACTTTRTSYSDLKMTPVSSNPVCPPCLLAGNIPYCTCRITAPLYVLPRASVHIKLTTNSHAPQCTRRRRRTCRLLIARLYPFRSPTCRQKHRSAERSSPPSLPDRCHVALG